MALIPIKNYSILFLHENDYVKGEFDTSFIENHLDELVNES